MSKHDMQLLNTIWSDCQWNVGSGNLFFKVDAERINLWRLSTC